MRRFLVKVTQPSDRLARKQISTSVHSMGSHFATHANWSRASGACTGTMVVESENERHALGVVPPSMRAQASVVPLESVAA